MTALVSPASSPGLSILVSSPSDSVNGSNGRAFGLTSRCPAAQKNVSSVVQSTSLGLHDAHVFDFLSLFQTLFGHHDDHDFLQLAVGVVWCCKFNCEVPSVGCALTWYHPASVFFVYDPHDEARNRPIVLAVSWV